MTTARVAVVGGGISGVACALELHRAGIAVDLFDRGHRLGGRMATRTLRNTGLGFDGRVVDLGAAYFTTRDATFGLVVESWISRGLAREWTDTFTVVDPEGITGVRTGPMRYAATFGLRSLVEDLANELPSVRNPHEVSDVIRAANGVLVDGEPYDAAALAMPAPQSADLTGEDAEPVRWEPVLALVAAYAERSWHEFDAMFVNDSAVLSFIADDGKRRGDDAPVLVAHSGAVLAAGHLDDPGAVAPLLLAALRHSVKSSADPDWFELKRWSLARPITAHPEPFGLVDGIGWCGDG